MPARRPRGRHEAEGSPDGGLARRLRERAARRGARPDRRSPRREPAQALTSLAAPPRPKRRARSTASTTPPTTRPRAMPAQRPASSRPGYKIISLMTRHDDVSLCIVRFRDRRGPQGCSCALGWPGQAAGGHQLPLGGDQLPDSLGRLCRGPHRHRDRCRCRAAAVRPGRGGRPGHGGWPGRGGRRGTRRSGRNAGNGRNGGNDAGACGASAPVAADRGAVSVPGDACPGRIISGRVISGRIFSRRVVPGCDSHRVGAGFRPVRGQFPAALPTRTGQASPLLTWGQGVLLLVVGLRSPAAGYIPAYEHDARP